MDSLPESEINIPVQVNLKPFYKFAENNIDIIYTSPNWPVDWINLDCTTRYKYHFRRGPLQFSSSGKQFTIGFNGFYQIIGATRVCVGNTVISPWTPPCRCGFDEGERRVKVNFVSSVSVLPDYKIRFYLKREEPVSVDKCTVCVFGIDITSQVLKGLKQELDLAKKSIEDSFGVLDLKPQMQLLWNQLSASFNLYNLGWLQINPQKFNLDYFNARQDTLNILLGLTAKPVIRFENPAVISSVVPDIKQSAAKPGLNLFLDAVLNYDSLSNLLNDQVKGKQFDFSKGKIRKTVIVNDCRLYGAGNEKLIIKMSFSGSNDGIVFFTGRPVYNEINRTVEISEIDFDVKSKNLLLKSADWLFNKRITAEISKAARFSLAGYIDTAKTMINLQLNREWIKGIKSQGKINEIKLAGIYPLSEHLIIRSSANGNLAVKVESIDFNF